MQHKKESNHLHVHDTTLHSTLHSPSGINLHHDLIHILIHHSILCHGGIGKVINFSTFTPHTSERIAGAADIFLFAGCVHVLAESLG